MKPPAVRRLAIPTVTLRQFPWLPAALAPLEIVPLERPFSGADAVAGWGAKTSAAYARRLARLRGLPYLTLEDGFYRSVGLGKAGAPAVSLTLDSVCPYFDASQQSDLERLLLTEPLDQSAESGLRLRQIIVERRLSKYNVGDDADVLWADGGVLPRILLVDQVAGDRSLPGGGASAHTFSFMRREAEALVRSGAACVFIKAHPDVRAGYGQGMIGRPCARLPAAPDADPHALLDGIDEVWTASSQFGFDALLRGVRVVTFAAPFYAGWGLTTDRPDAAAPHAHEARRRRSQRTLSIDALVGIAVGAYPRYYDPVRKCPCSAEVALERLGFWRDQYYRRKGPVTAIGFAWHKRRLLRAHLGAAGQATRFVRSETPRTVDVALAAGAKEIVAWGDRLSLAAEQQARNAGVRVTRVEDGFVRSKGLGRKKTPPWSLCFDSMATYYDASRASDLEQLLTDHDFSAAERARGREIIGKIVAGGVTKYNLAGDAPDLRKLAQGRPVVLAMAQVPGDASWRHGNAPFQSNLAFLAAVRADCPDAFLVFKEHPDLVAGLRPGATDLGRAAAIADLVLKTGDAAALYPETDALHVMTSLAGFEALLRNTPVVCWGTPFYAGWGLTTDRVPCERRTRKLAIEELVAGALALYPAYLDPVSKIPCMVEDVLSMLAHGQAEHRLLPGQGSSEAKGAEV